MNETKNFAINHALRLERQLQTSPADAFGGGSVLTPGAGDKIPCEPNAEFTTGSEYYTDAAANGTQHSGEKRKTAELPSLAGLTVKSYTQGLERLLFSALGYTSPAGPTAVASRPGFFSHFFAVPPQGNQSRPYTAAEAALVGDEYDEDDRINSYLAIAQELGPYERILRNVVVKEVELAASSQNPLTLKVTGPAERLVRDPAKTSTPSWTFPASAFQDYFFLSDCRCYIGPATTAFTPDTPHTSISELSVKLSKGITDTDIPTGTSNQGLSRAEPRASEKNTLTAELGIYLHDRTLYEDWFANQTPLHCKLVFSRGNYQWTILLPRLFCTLAEPNFDGAGSTKLSLEAGVTSNASVLSAIQNSFLLERSVSGTEQPWPAFSLLGIIAVSQESRNPVRWS